MSIESEYPKGPGFKNFIPRRFTRKHYIALGAILLAALLYFSLSGSNDAPNPFKPEFKTVEVQQGPLTVKISAKGIVEPNFKVEVKSKASGEVLQFNFEEGDRVRKGDLLLQLDKSDEIRNVGKAQADVSSATANFKKSKASLLLQKTRYKNDLKASHSEVEAAEANLQESEDKLKRQQNLFARKFVSQEALDAARTTFKVNQEKRIQAKTKLSAAKDGIHDIEIRKNDVELAQAEVQRADIALDEAQDRLEETEIFSPIDGVILQKLVEEGQIIASGISNVSGGTALATLADMSRMFIIADVDETDIGSVTVGQNVAITTDAYPDETFTGKVTRIAPQGEVESSITIFKVKIEIQGPGKNILKPVMSANIDIISHQIDDAVYVSREAVRKNGGQTFAMILDADEPRKTDIEIGVENPIHTRILSGLTPGQKVIVGDWEKAIEDAKQAAKKGSSLRKILWMLRSK